MTQQLQPDEWSALLDAAYGPDLTGSHPPLPPNLDEADALALLALAPDAETAMTWWRAGPAHWPPLHAAQRRWQEYCDQVRDAVLGNTNGSNTAVFGLCVRCGSQRVIVTPGRVTTSQRSPAPPRTSRFAVRMYFVSFRWWY